MDDERIIWGIGGLLLLLLVLCITDCTNGTKRHCPGTVSQHVYHPAHTTVSVSHAGKSTSVHTHYHPAQYRVLVLCQSPGHVADINVGGFGYARLHDGERVTVGERIGRWSGITWGQWIEHQAAADY